MMCQKLGLKRDFRKYKKRLVKVVFNDVHDRKEMLSLSVVHHIYLNETRQKNNKWWKIFICANVLRNIQKMKRKESVLL